MGLNLILASGHSLNSGLFNNENKSKVKRDTNLTDSKKKEVLERLIDEILENTLREEERINLRNRIKTISYFGEFSDYFVPELKRRFPEYGFRRIEETEEYKPGEYRISFKKKDLEYICRIKKYN